VDCSRFGSGSFLLGFSVKRIPDRLLYMEMDTTDPRAALVSHDVPWHVLLFRR
jgi:hypothetical protein